MPIILENLNDITNFNHKLADTIVYVNDWKKWAYTKGIIDTGRSGTRFALELTEYEFPSERHKSTFFDLDPKTLTINIDLLKITPECGYYNHFINGEACFLSRNPVRNIKQTITQRNSYLDDSLWKLIPVGVTRDSPEIEGVLRSRNHINSWIHILNTNKYLPFGEAVASTNSGEMFSCAFNKSFAVSINLISRSNKGDLLLWYEQFPIGQIYIEGRQINLEHKVLNQEVLDILRDQNTQWQVNV